LIADFVLLKEALFPFNASLMSVERTLLAAQGYMELDMPDEALRELNSLPAEAQAGEDALQMRLFLHMRAKEWLPSLAVCEQLRHTSPDCSSGYIHGAFCLHELGRTSEAKELLLQAPALLQEEPTFHYNLGCYNAILGNIEDAQRHLSKSFQMDKKFREIAMVDPDLQSIRSLL